MQMSSTEQRPGAFLSTGTRAWVSTERTGLAAAIRHEDLYPEKTFHSA